MDNKNNQSIIQYYDGFSGGTHVGITMLIASLIILFAHIPSQFSNPMFLFSAFIIFVGGALLPDADNDISTISIKLGLLSKPVKIIYDVLSEVAFTLTHTRYDRMTPSRHRMLGHTPFLYILIGSLTWALYQFRYKDTSKYSNPIFIFFIIIITISAYAGISVILYRPFSWLKMIPKKIKDIIPIILTALVAMICCLQLDSFQDQILIEVFCAGAVMHCMEDFFTQGSVPLFYPIPTVSHGHLMFWAKPWILGKFQIYTGGAVDTIIGLICYIASIVVFGFHLGWWQAIIK